MGACESCNSKNETKNKPLDDPIIEQNKTYSLKKDSINLEMPIPIINYNESLNNSFIAQSQFETFGNSFQIPEEDILKPIAIPVIPEVNNIMTLQNPPLVNNQFEEISFNTPKTSLRENNLICIPFSINYSKKLGEGIFANIYAGTFFPTNEEVAIKIKKNDENLYVLNEILIYQKINGLEGIPKIYWSGKCNDNDTIIMQVLGQSLQKYFYTRNKKLNLSEIKSIGIQALNILEFVHNNGIVHGDIKPSSFYFGLNENFKIYLADFGFAFEFINFLTGNHISFEKEVYSVGDLRFCSKNCLQGYKKSRRDDIESLGYTLVYLLKGFLPWESSNNVININQIKLSTTLNFLCSGLHFNLWEFIRYSWNLKFNEQPNYNYLRDLLRNVDLLYIPKIKAVILKAKKKFKEMTNGEFDQESVIANTFIPKEDLIIIERDYVKNKNSQVFNNKLRMLGPMGLNEEEIQLYNALMRAINSNRTKEDYLVHRFVWNNYLENVFNFKPSSDIYYNLMMIKNQIGSRKIEKGFMSCYMTKNHVIVRNIQLEIEIPKGTRAYITRNKEESEIILPCNTEYEVKGAKIVNNIIKIFINIINYDENSSNLFFDLSGRHISSNQSIVVPLNSVNTNGFNELFL